MEQPENKPKQLCTFRIMFPVDSDDAAIEYKKKITDILSAIPDAQIQFGLVNRPPTAPPMV